MYKNNMGGLSVTNYFALVCHPGIHVNVTWKTIYIEKNNRVGGTGAETRRGSESGEEGCSHLTLGNKSLSSYKFGSDCIGHFNMGKRK
jgi:hypothetical protein